jgi:formate dehydrogenase subunit gamma
MTFLVRIRLVVLATLVLGMFAIAPATAQKLGPDGAPNPTASVTSQRGLFKQVPRAEGRSDIPDTKAAVLIQPAGRTWDYFHEVLLHRGGAIVIVGTIALLGLAYLIMGRIRISAGRSEPGNADHFRSS